MAHIENDYRIGDEPAPHRGSEAPVEKRSASTTRVTLWALVLVGIVANAATTFSGLHPVVSALIGVATLACIVLLVLDYVKNRK